VPEGAGGQSRQEKGNRVMSHKFAEIAFTPTVKQVQERLGSRNSYARMEAGAAPRNNVLGPREVEFLGERDSFYIASVSETGWPYIQHRGGSKGFMRILDENTIGFPDYRGNRQYISVGNLMTNDRVALFFMDYPNRTRLKLLGRATLIDTSNRVVLERLQVPDYRARIERGVLISVEAFDWNCQQHITQRYTLADVERATASLRQRIAELETELGWAAAKSL
jgi:predicted pyridoxine 5'-phosphate oxidase superfamily flavin-nucleotide-binding protein